MTEEEVSNVRKRIVNESRYITGDISGNISGKNKSQIAFQVKRDPKFQNSAPIYRQRQFFMVGNNSMQNILRRFEDQMDRAQSRLTDEEKQLVRAQVNEATGVPPIAD